MRALEHAEHWYFSDSLPGWFGLCRVTDGHQRLRRGLWNYRFWGWSRHRSGRYWKRRRTYLSLRLNGNPLGPQRDPIGALHNRLSTPWQRLAQLEFHGLWLCRRHRGGLRLRRRGDNSDGVG